MIRLEVIKSRARKLKISQQEIADELGISRQSVNQKLSGKTEFTAGEITKISNILKLQIREILTTGN